MSKTELQLTVIPEPHGHTELSNFALSHDSRFWVYTSGLQALGKYDLELRDVPALWVTPASELVKMWAEYSLSEKEILPGQDLVERDIPVPVMMKAIITPDVYWHGQKVLRLVVNKIMVRCSHAHEQEPVLRYDPHSKN